jgi:hypothetical protein
MPVTLPAFLTNRSRSTAAYGQPVVRSRATAGQTLSMGTLGGCPYPPALWLRRAKPDYANAIASPRDRLPGKLL